MSMRIGLIAVVNFPDGPFDITNPTTSLSCNTNDSGHAIEGVAAFTLRIIRRVRDHPQQLLILCLERRVVDRFSRPCLDGRYRI